MENEKKQKNGKPKGVANGEGSFYHSETLDRWIFQYTEPSGKRQTLRQKKNESERAFRKRVTTVKEKLDNGTYIGKSKDTIYSLAKELNENQFKRNKIKPTTYNRNLYTLEIIKNSEIANIPIQKITFVQIQHFIDKQQKYSNSNIDKIFQFLGRVFEEALKRDYIIKNPMLKVEKPKSEKKDKKVEAFTIDEQKMFLTELENKTKYKNIFIIALYSGMRIGEILALKKEDINWKEKTITIKRTLSKTINGEVSLSDDGDTKTYNSLRTIPISPLFEKELKQAYNNTLLNINNLLFIQSIGRLINPSNVNSEFKRICVKANLAVKPYIIKRKGKNGKIKEINSKTSAYNEHMLRHTYATRMIEAGVPAEVLQKLLGHKDITVTINTYTSIFNKYKQEQIDKYVNYIQNTI